MGTDRRIVSLVGYPSKLPTTCCCIDFEYSKHENYRQARENISRNEPGFCPVLCLACVCQANYLPCQICPYIEAEMELYGLKSCCILVYSLFPGKTGRFAPQLDRLCGPFCAVFCGALFIAVLPFQVCRFANDIAYGGCKQLSMALCDTVFLPILFFPCNVERLCFQSCVRRYVCRPLSLAVTSCC